TAQRFAVLDLLSTLTVVLNRHGEVIFANAALENTLGMSRRMLDGSRFSTFIAQPALLDNALAGGKGLDYAAMRFDTTLVPPVQEPLMVHATIAPLEERGEVLVE